MTMFETIRVVESKSVEFISLSNAWAMVVFEWYLSHI